MPLEMNRSGVRFGGAILGLGASLLATPSPNTAPLNEAFGSLRAPEREQPPASTERPSERMSNETTLDPEKFGNVLREASALPLSNFAIERDRDFRKATLQVAGREVALTDRELLLLERSVSSLGRRLAVVKPLGAEAEARQLESHGREIAGILEGATRRAVTLQPKLAAATPFKTIAQQYDLEWPEKVIAVLSELKRLEIFSLSEEKSSANETRFVASFALESVNSDRKPSHCSLQIYPYSNRDIDRARERVDMGKEEVPSQLRSSRWSIVKSSASGEEVVQRDITCFELAHLTRVSRLLAVIEATIKEKGPESILAEVPVRSAVEARSQLRSYMHRYLLGLPVGVP